MKGLFLKIKRVIASRYMQKMLFWMQAIRSKLHFGEYNSRRVVLLRLDLIGDCTMFTDAAKAIREFYKDREMTVICLSISRAIFERMGCFDRIITVDFRPEAIQWRKVGKLISEIRKETYDLLLQPQLSKFPIADIIAAAVRCNRRVSIEPISPHGNSSPKWINMTNFLYDTFIPYPRDGVSEFDFYGAFVRGIGVSHYRTARPKLPYYPQHFVNGKYYVLYPGGSYAQKMWPAERFAKIANHLYEETGLTGVILGTAAEQYVCEQVKKHLTPKAAMSIIDLSGKTTVFDVIDIIGNAELVVSNDTSGVHIACATNTPSVSNVGGWHFDRFLPYHLEDQKPDDQIPLVAYTHMNCYYCILDRNIVKQRNPECLRRLECGEPCECIWNVTYEQMRELVDRVIRARKLE